MIILIFFSKICVIGILLLEVKNFNTNYLNLNFPTLTMESKRQESEIRIDSLGIGCDWNRATVTFCLIYGVTILYT